MWLKAHITVLLLKIHCAYIQSSVTICEKSMYLKLTPDWNLSWLDCQPSFAYVERRVTSRLNSSSLAPSDPDTTRMVPQARQPCGKPPSPKCKLRIMPMVDIWVDSTTFSSPSEKLGLLFHLILLKVQRLLSQASTSFRPLPPAFRLTSTWPASWPRNLIALTSGSRELQCFFRRSFLLLHQAWAPRRGTECHPCPQPERPVFRSPALFTSWTWELSL